MSLSRRSFLLWSGITGLLGLVRRLHAATVSPDTLLSSEDSDSQVLDSAQTRCLQAWFETLLPADESSPGATALGIAEQISAKAIENTDYQRLLHAGCRWLDVQAQARGKLAFAELDVTGREGIVRLAEESAEKSLPRTFFLNTRDDAFGFYYTQPQTWDMLDYPGPPQPRGFMDYSRPPAG